MGRKSFFNLYQRREQNSELLVGIVVYLTEHIFGRLSASDELFSWYIYLDYKLMQNQEDTRKRKPTSSPPDNKGRPCKRPGGMAGNSSSTTETNVEMVDPVDQLTDLLTREALPAAIVKALTEESVLAAISSVISKSLDTHMQHIQKLLKQKDDKIAKLENGIEQLRTDCDELEQYERRNSLRLNSVPEIKDEVTDVTVIKLARTVGVTLQPSDISRSHRIGKPSSDPRKPIALLVKFATYRAREKVYEKRKEAGGFYVTEDLTKLRDGIFYKARQARNTGTFKHVWCRDGRIKIRTPNDRVHTVCTMHELERLLQ